MEAILKVLPNVLITDLPGIGAEYNKSLDNFEECKDIIAL